MKTSTFVRKPFKVEGIQVTEENMPEVAKWCRGTLERDRSQKPYIAVNVQKAANERQKQGFVGDWILKFNNGFKVFQDKSFHNTFQPETA